MSHYRIALALTLAIVLLVVGPFLYLGFLYLGGFARFSGSAVWLLAKATGWAESLALAVLLGLWLQSYIFRYCGGVLFLVLGGFFIWQNYSQLGQTSALLDSYWFILGALYLFDGAILLFSRPFAVEF